MLRKPLVNNIVGRLLDRITEPVVPSAVEYWCSIDKDVCRIVVNHRSDGVDHACRDGCLFAVTRLDGSTRDAVAPQRF
jgi:hypothetical protein